MLPGCLVQHRLIPQPAVIDLTGRQRIAGHPRTQQLRHRGIGNAKDLHRAVGLFNRDFQVVTVAGGVDVLQGKRTRRYRGLIDNVAALTHRYQGVALRHAANFRRVGAHSVREHVVIGRKVDPAQANGVEEFAVGKNLPAADDRVDLRDRPLEIGLVAVPVRFALLLLPVQVTDVLEQPAVPGETGVKPQIGAAVIGAVVRRGVAGPGVGHPAEIQRRNAFIPELRADKVFQALIFVDLRHGNFQPQGGLNQVVFNVFFVTPLLQPSAVAFLLPQLRIELFRGNAVALEHLFGVADPHVAVFIAGDLQLVAPFPLAVGVDVEGIGALRDGAGGEA